MELRYADRELERQCTEGRYMQRKLGAQRAKALRLRLDELRRAEELADLLFFGGKKIPELMKGLGKGVRSFKEGMNNMEKEIEEEPVKKE